MNKRNKVIVIGGGASGLVAGIFASKCNDVTIIERDSKCGRKILVSGNGKCNYFNSEFTSSHFNSSSSIDSIISKNNQDKILEFFDSIGIVPNIKNDYYYPMSNQSVSVVEALIKESSIRGVNIITNESVSDIINDNEYIVKTNKNEYRCDKVVLACGSHAYYKEESIGYNLLKKFGHSINTVVPSLVQLVGSNIINASGVRCECDLSLYEDGKLIKKSNGELQLTDYGISGICVYQLSSLVSRGLVNKKEETIHINFMPFIDDFILYMNERNKKVKNRNISELFDGLMNYKLSNSILDMCGIDYKDKWDNISYLKKNKLSKMITDYEMNIIDTKGYKSAQTCSGGVLISEIDINTMESKKTKDLYITGELLDCDGECGGYNLGFAWITGMIAGSSLNE